MTLSLALFLFPAMAADSPPQAGTLEIAAALPLSGEGGNAFGKPTLEGIQLAIEEANASGAQPKINLGIYDDKTSPDGARAAAAEIAPTNAIMVLGPAYSSAAIAAGPIYAQAGMAVLPPTATSDLITQNPTTFRIVFKNSEQAALLATYAYRVLGKRKADVIVEDNPYGKTLRNGFQAAAEKLGLDVDYFPFKTIEEGEAAARTIASDPGQPAAVFLTLDTDGAPILAALRQAGGKGPALGTDSFGGENFSALFADRPEERAHPGYYTDGVYGIAPVNIDSANAEILNFNRRFKAHFGHDADWQSVAGYDAARLAVAALHAAGNGDTAARRKAALAYLASLDSPARAISGLLGPIWFDADHARPVAIRVGRFNGDRFESAPMQIVPVTTPSADELTSGAVFEMQPGRFARLQRVVYSGIYLNEISHIDLTKSSFGADFYVWLRYAKDGGPDSVDPADIIFPNLLSGVFDSAKPAEQGVMPDDTIYRLWRVQGEFRNDFDLHRFPFDWQRLTLPFYNASGASDRIVYVVDKRAGGAPGMSVTPGQASAQMSRIALEGAFDDLTQWRPLGGVERRENLVTNSSLGDPRRGGIESYRELSGFEATFDVSRRALATVAKTLMPLLLMTLIIYTTLYFPPVLIKEKVTVAITGALSGAVLLTAINSQLGSIGYTIALEYAFFVFFGLTTFVIVSALAAQHFHHVKRLAMARATERGTQAIFLLAIAGLLCGAWYMSASAEVVP
jgi:ABC-type branched-subunit amino acid transport system substrate-binding protein